MRSPDEEEEELAWRAREIPPYVPQPLPQSTQPWAESHANLWESASIAHQNDVARTAQEYHDWHMAQASDSIYTPQQHIQNPS